jgi:DNA primase
MLQEAAVLTRAMLTELGLESWLKTSGGKGLHVVVPITPKLDYTEVKAFSQAIVKHMARVIPSKFFPVMGGGNRVGKIFVDYLRNGHGQTTAIPSFDPGANAARIKSLRYGRPSTPAGHSGAEQFPKPYVPSRLSPTTHRLHGFVILHGICRIQKEHHELPTYRFETSRCGPDRGLVDGIRRCCR